MPKPASPETREEAVAAYVAGESSTSIGKRLRVSSSSVTMWVREAGHTVRTRGGKLPDDDASPLAYMGGWERRGLIQVPLFPEQRSA